MYNIILQRIKPYVLSIIGTIAKQYTLAYGIDVGQGINVGPGKFGKKSKHRAWKICQKE